MLLWISYFNALVFYCRMSHVFWVSLLQLQLNFSWYSMCNPCRGVAPGPLLDLGSPWTSTLGWRHPFIKILDTPWFLLQLGCYGCYGCYGYNVITGCSLTGMILQLGLLSPTLAGWWIRNVCFTSIWNTIKDAAPVPHVRRRESKQNRTGGSVC